MNTQQAEDLIRLVMFKKNLTEEELAVSLEVNPAYIAQMRTRGNFTDKFMKKLVKHYANVINSDTGKVITMEEKDAIIAGIAARQQVHGRYIAEIYAKGHNVSVTKVLHEMEQLEREKTELLLRSIG